jgi:ATP-dependent Clp protease ATP-binding subunit ClpB
VMNELDRHFRPEFLNRLDEIIMFHSLSASDIARIVDIQLRHLTKLLKARGLTMELTADARHHLAERGYDPVYGARPLKRTIQRELQDPLAVHILEGRVVEGDHIIVDVNAEGDGLQFSTMPQTEVDAV